MEEIVYTGTQPTKNKECKHCGPTLYRQRADGKWVCISCQKKRTVAQRVKNKRLLMEERGGKCERCGFSDIRALDWHHSKPLNGDRDYYNSLQNKSIKEFRAHTSECELLCANCHRIEHSS